MMVIHTKVMKSTASISVARSENDDLDADFFADIAIASLPGNFIDSSRNSFASLGQDFFVVVSRFIVTKDQESVIVHYCL